MVVLAITMDHHSHVHVLFIIQALLVAMLRGRSRLPLMHVRQINASMEVLVCLIVTIVTLVFVKLVIQDKDVRLRTKELMVVYQILVIKAPAYRINKLVDLPVRNIILKQYFKAIIYLKYIKM